MQLAIHAFYPVVKKNTKGRFGHVDDDNENGVCIDLVSDDEEVIGGRPPTNSIPAQSDGDNHSKAFNLLPIEMNQRVAKYLDCDQDLDNFRTTCKATFYSIDGDGMSFWRRRFLESFDFATPHKRINNTWYRKEYLERKHILNEGANFTLGHSKDENDSLELLRTLICGKNASSAMSKNIGELRRFAQNHNLLQTIFDHQNQKYYAHGGDLYPRPEEPFLQMIQIILAPLMLELDFISDEKTFQFPLSQQMAYADAVAQPIFKGSHINFPWVLHQLNFWKYHLTRGAEMTLFDAYNELEVSERPHFWNGMLEQKQQDHAMGKSWKGAYGWVDHPEVHEIRKGENEYCPIQDEFSGEEGDRSFQTISLNLNTSGKADWPQLFDDHLRSLKPPVVPARTRAQKRAVDPDVIANRESLSFRFTGDGSDMEEAFLADGWLNPLPPQHGVPGWQRMTMMKYFADQAGAIDYSSLWAYEGVVLPGGQIIVGRWWSPSDDDPTNHYTGPFIQWCVDGPEQQFKDDASKSCPEL